MSNETKRDVFEEMKWELIRNLANTIDQPVFDWIHENSDAFARAWLDGYEVEVNEP